MDRDEVREPEKLSSTSGETGGDGGGEGGIRDGGGETTLSLAAHPASEKELFYSSANGKVARILQTRSSSNPKLPPTHRVPT